MGYVNLINLIHAQWELYFYEGKEENIRILKIKIGKPESFNTTKIRRDKDEKIIFIHFSNWYGY